MGNSTYSHDDYVSRSSYRVSHSIPVFKHTHDVATGAAPKAAHPSLEPKGVKVRESRDSAEHPIAIPIAVGMDVTGSMSTVPAIMEERLSKLMGCFLDDKASGKKYLGDGYPAILIGAFDDYYAMGGVSGTLQVGQFESGMEIDQNLENLWLTGRGGGTYDESYELFLYFMARHTAHDHFDKRGRKGYIFLIGDEHPYKFVEKHQVKQIIGDDLQGDISLAAILEEVQQRYHVFMIIPNLTNHYSDPGLERDWVKLLSQQNVIKLADPNKICETIVGAVAICEGNIGVDELESDGVSAGDLSAALVKVATGREIDKYSTEGLAPVIGSAAGTERL